MHRPVIERVQGSLTAVSTAPCDLVLTLTHPSLLVVELGARPKQAAAHVEQAAAHVAERLAHLTFELFARICHLSDIDRRAERQTRAGMMGHCLPMGGEGR